MSDLQDLLGPQADQETLVPAWLGHLALRGYLVLQGFQGKLGGRTVLQENQGSRDLLASLDHQDHQDPLGHK